MSLIDALDTPLLEDYFQSPTGGQISNSDPTQIDATHAFALSNANLTVQGVRQRARGYDPLGFPQSISGSATLTGLFGYDAPDYPASNPNTLLGKWGQQIWSLNNVSDPTVWTKRVDAGILDTQSYYVSCVAAGRLYIAGCVPSAPGSYPQAIWVDAVNAGWGTSTVSLTLTTGGAPALSFNPRQIFYAYKNTWALGENTLMWNHVTDYPHRAPSVTNYFQFNDNDPCVAASIMREQTPRLVVWRTRSIYLLDIYWATDGNVASSTQNLDFTKASIRPIVDEVGCVATRALCWAPGAGAGVGDYFFLARDGIRSLQRALNDTQGGVGLPLSFRIQDVIDRINWVHADRSCAAFHNGLAYFSVPVDGALHPNFLIIYDTNRDAFWTSDTAAGALARITPPSRPTTLYFASGIPSQEFYTGGSGGTFTGNQVYQFESSSFKGVGLTATLPYTEITRAINFAVKPGLGDFARNRLDSTEIVYESGATNATLTLSLRLNDSSTWTLLGYVPLAAGLDGLQRSRFSLRHLPPSYRVQGRIQDLTSTSGWKILTWQIRTYPQNQIFSG